MLADIITQNLNLCRIPGMRVGSHGGYRHEIQYHAWQIETGSWLKCIGSYGRKGVPPAPCNFGAS